MRAPTWMSILLLVILAPSASAHGFGGSGPATPFVMPGWAGWSAGALVVTVSFMIVAATLTRSPSTLSAKSEDAHPPRSGLSLGRVAGLVVLALALVPAFHSRSGSFVPGVVLWLIAWSALPIIAYASGFDFERVSPFRALATLADRARAGALPLRYPPWLGAWPAVVGVLMFTGVEVWTGTLVTPVMLSRLLAGYVVVTFACMVAFGADAWLANGEVFTRTLALWRAASPFRGSRWRGAGGLRALELRASDVALVVALLLGVNFDAFISTTSGAGLLLALARRIGARGAFTAIVLSLYAIFWLVLVVTAARARAKSRSLEPLGHVLRRFAPALLPIAVGYHLAHNLPYLIETSPRFAFALADPLDIGKLAPWTAGTPLTLAWPLLGGPLVPIFQIACVLGGHVAAVVVAHKCSLDAFDSRVQAFHAEVQVTFAMVAYTCVGLWILGAPQRLLLPGWAT